MLWKNDSTVALSWGSFSAHASNHAGRLHQFPVVMRCVFNSLIGMEQTALHWSALIQRHQKRSSCQIRVALPAHRPANNLARKKIHHNRVVHIAISGVDVSKVTGPVLTWSTCCSRLAELISCVGVERLTPWTPRIQPCARGLDACRFHQPADSPDTATEAFTAQRLMDPAGAVSSSEALMQF